MLATLFAPNTGNSSRNDADLKASSMLCYHERRQARPGEALMANVKKRVSEDAPGDFFVDTTCIDCDTCRQIAPRTFGEGPGTAYVRSQPQSADDRRDALRALICCPTGSIGAGPGDDPRTVMTDFPLVVEEPVYY